MRILLLAPHPYYIDRGTPIDVDLVLRALSERGEQVDVVTYHEGRDVDYPNVSLHRIRAPAWVRQVGPGISAAKLFCDVLLLREAWRRLGGRQYDVIHAGEEAVFIAMLFRRLYGIPYIYDMDSSIAQQTVEKLPWLRPIATLLDWCEARAIRGSLAAAPVCNALAELARARGAPFVETLHDISQLGEEDFRPEARLRERLGIEGPLVMYVGNLEPYQGVDLLLESVALAMRERADFHLVIAGGTPRSIAAYETKAKARGIQSRTHFIGPWPNDRLGGLLAEADVLVAPRIRGINTPMKIFPYLHSGRPVLVTDLPTHSQVLDSSVAMLAPAEPHGFARAIVQLTSDAGLRSRLGRAGRVFVEQGHTFAAYRRRLNRLYDHVQAALSPRAEASGLLTRSRV